MDLVIWTKRVLGRVIFMQITLRSVFTANSSLVNEVSVKFAAWTRVCSVLCETSKQAVNLSVHKDGGRPSTQILGILDAEADVA
jgi:hypothetical protein